jgi:NTP pyrophosphatase (non-canonical NTP hydrolase)
MFNLNKAVTEFHIKHNFPVGLNLTDQNSKAGTVLCDKYGQMLLEFAKSLEGTSCMFQGKDDRIFRMHLMLEELGELLKAMADGDIIKTADGLGDLLYVVEGVAVSFGLPTPEILAEIHKSNMTKKYRDTENARMRDKGPDYVPPDIASAICDGMARVAWEKKLADNPDVSVEMLKHIQE